MRPLVKKGYRNEILVVDNNSTDKSAYIARKEKARVLFEPVPGYGSAIRSGFDGAHGSILLMADADRTYPLRDIPRFVKEIEHGSEIVLGSRFLGAMEPGAMPWLNRHIGNPILTWLLNIFYNTSINDSQTGMRALTRKTYERLQLKSRGMEFASEMIIKAVVNKVPMKEIPISYARRIGISKLSPLRDTWRHILAILMYSPTYALIFPGVLLTVFGGFFTIRLLFGPMKIGSAGVDIHTMMASVVMVILGFQVILLGFFSRVFTARYLNLSYGQLTHFLLKYVTVDRLLITGFFFFSAGFLYMTYLTFLWVGSGYTAFAHEREFLAACCSAAIGGQMMYSSFLYAVLRK